MGSATIAAYQFCPGFNSYCVCAAARWAAAAISPTTMLILAQELIIVVCSSLQRLRKKKEDRETCTCARVPKERAEEVRNGVEAIYVYIKHGNAVLTKVSSLMQRSDKCAHLLLYIILIVVYPIVEGARGRAR